MSSHLLGQTASLLAALTWAFALVLFKRSGEQVAPLPLNLFKNTVALLLFALTLALAALAGVDRVAALGEHPVSDLCLLLLSGLIGIALADTLLFYSLNLIGVGLMAIVDCCYSPLAVLLAWLLLGERLMPPHYIGAALIVAAVFSATHHDLPPHRTRAQIVVGTLLAVLAIALMVVGIVIVKPILESMSVLWATVFRLIGGMLFLMLFACLGRRWQSHWRIFRPSRSWRYALPGAILGTYLCLFLWIAGFKYTYASIAAVLSQTSVVFQALLAALLLKEDFGPRKIIALTLAVIGVVIVTLSDHLVAAFHTYL